MVRTIHAAERTQYFRVCRPCITSKWLALHSRLPLFDLAEIGELTSLQTPCLVLYLTSNMFRVSVLQGKHSVNLAVYVTTDKVLMQNTVVISGK